MKRAVLGIAAIAVGLAILVGWMLRDEGTHDVVITQIHEGGLVATYFRPKGNATVPAVVVLGGSEGGIQAALAKSLAERGWGALAIAYFGVEGVPKHLANIPLEYFDLGVRWLSHQPTIDMSGLAVVGGSRGGELALLLASHNPLFKRVAAFVPSSVVWGGFGSYLQHPVSAWTLKGQPLPFVPPAEEISGPAPRLMSAAEFIAALAQQDKVEAASIPVESIQGSVLLLSGEDDQLWPSSLMSRQVMERLQAAHHPYRFEHIAYPGAGHLIIKGIDPGITEIRRPTGLWLKFGGTKAANRAAQEQSWKKLLEFLRADSRQKIQARVNLRLLSGTSPCLYYVTSHRLLIPVA